MRISLLVAALLNLMIYTYYSWQGRLRIISSLKEACMSQWNKQILRSLFHCQTGFLFISSLYLFACALGLIPRMYAYSLLLFIGLNHGIFAIWHCYIAILSPPDRGIGMYIMAVLFLFVALFALLGALTSCV